MKTFLLKSHFLTIVFLIANLFFASVAFGQAAITSDQPDYKPGTIATFTGVGFQSGESVHLQVLHSNIYPDDTADVVHDSWIVSADVNGKFVTTWQVSATHCVGKILRAIAIGQSSGENVWHEFTDPLITSTSTGGNWNSGSTWVGGNVPLAADDVVIAVGATVTVIDDRSAKSVSILGGGSNTKLLINSGVILTVSGNVTINAPGTNSITNELAVGTGTLTIGGNLSVDGANGGGGRKGIFSISSGTVNLAGNIINPSNNSNAQIVFSGSGILKVAGSFSWGGNSTFIPGTGTIEYNGAAQTILGPASYYKLSTTGSGIKSMNTGITIANTFDIGSGTTVDALGFTTTISGAATLNVNGTLNFSNSSGLFQSGTTGVTTLIMGSIGKIRTVDNLGLGPAANASLVTQSGGTWITSSINSNGSIEYYLTGAQNVTARTYNNLLLNSSGIKTFGGSLIINENLSISGTAIANLGNTNSTAGSLTLGGVAQPIMSWGSTASAAIHKNSTYFGTTATGILNPCAAITAALSGTSSICNGSNAILTVTISGGLSPYTVVYTGGTGGTVTSYISGSNISVSPISNTTYTLISVTDANGCAATVTGSAVVTVNTVPVLGTIGNKNVNEQAILSFTATSSDQDVPSQTLTYT
ncbi:beta strand repeat-containing protein, partial [Flavobacterium sp. GT3P67]|uniref:beta strand repeat-containing protein n=1 Tax=Flavobacterium sp. GT3P67 TaxID=2541722 RepID=UPI001042A175